MYKLIRMSLFLVLITTCTAFVTAQDARIKFDHLKDLEGRASDVVEVNIEGKILNLAKRVLKKVDNKDAKIVGEAIDGLKGIYVRVYRFDEDYAYSTSDIDLIRSQLTSPGWEKLANVRSKKKDQRIDVYTMFSGDDISGVTVLMSEKKGLSLINVVGPIDIDLLAELGGKLNIPEIDVEIDNDGN